MHGTPLDARRLVQLLLVAGLVAFILLLVLSCLEERYLRLWHEVDESLLVLAVTGLVVYVTHTECRELPTCWLLLLLLLALGALLPNFFFRSGCGGVLTACKSNLKNLGTGLEMYATDHQGLYPRSLSGLTPNYLKTIPTCPSAGKDTYSRFFRSGVEPDNYTIVCGGCYHHGAGLDTPNYPQYTCTVGLIERP